MADWPSITDDDNTGLTGTPFNLAFFNLIKAYIQAGSHQSGLDAGKPAECSPGDVYHATDTEIYYICFVANVWSEVGGAADPDQVRLPDPEAGDFASPTVHNKSSETTGAAAIICEGVTGIELYTGGYIRLSQKITLTGNTLEKVSFHLAKTGNPPGTVYARIRRVSDDGVIEESATTYVAGDLPGSLTWKDFAFTCAPNEEVYVSLEYNEGSSGNQVDSSYNEGDVISGCFSYWWGAGPWADIGGADFSIKIYFIAGGEAVNSVDDNTDTAWFPDPPNEAGAWISWDIGSLKFIGGCRIYWGSEVAYRPTEYKLYVSANGSDWTEVIHETEAAPASAWKEYDWYVQYARYIKLVVTTHGASGTKVYEVDEYSLVQDQISQRHGHGGLS